MPQKPSSKMQADADIISGISFNINDVWSAEAYLEGECLMRIFSYQLPTRADLLDFLIPFTTVFKDMFPQLIIHLTTITGAVHKIKASDYDLI